MVVGTRIASVLWPHDQAGLLAGDLRSARPRTGFVWVPICGVDRIRFRQTVNKPTVVPA